MRALYTLLWLLALPFLPLRLWWRGRREPGYREHIGERFGRYPAARRPARRVLWIHAVSLGETRAAVPLVDRADGARIPDATLLLTHMTATGRAAGHALFGDRVVQAWLPYDVPFAVRAFLAPLRVRARASSWRPSCGRIWCALARDAGRAAVSRQRAPVGAIGGGLRAGAVADATDARGARRRRGADRRRRRAARGARRAGAGRHRQPQVRRRGAGGGARARAASSAALRRSAPRLARRVDARRRGGADRSMRSPRIRCPAAR